MWQGDKLVSELISKFPVGMRPTRLFVNRTTSYQLQASRSATVVYNGSKSGNGSEVWAPMPIESNGIPITVTDGITAEAAS